MNALDKIPATLVGERLRQSRDAAKITQAEAATHLGVARTTVVAIEKGERRVRPEELVKLAQLYGDTVSRLLRESRLPAGLALQYRKGPRGQDMLADSPVVNRILESLVDFSLELENLLAFRPSGIIPSETAIMKTQMEAQSEDLAVKVRGLLGFGAGSSFTNLIRALESEYLLRIFVYPLPSEICGAFAFDPTLGGFVVLNRQHAPVRRLRTLGHELGHFLTAQWHSDILLEGEKETSPEERFANNFTDAFLMPAAEVRRQFNSLSSIRGTFSVAELCELAEHFRVSLEAMTRRMEELRLLPPATFETHVQPRAHKLKGQDRNEAARDALGRTRFEKQVVDAVARELLSEGRASEMLAVDRAVVREMVDVMEDAGDVSLV